MLSILLLLIVLFPYVAGAAIYFTGCKNKSCKRWPAVASVLVVLVAATLLVLLSARDAGEIMVNGLFIGGLSFKFTGFRTVYIFITALLWCFSVVFSIDFLKESKKLYRYDAFILMTLGSVMGVFAAADFITLFVFFELMTFASYPVVLHDEEKKSIKAANIYLAIGVFGGMSMLVGLLLINHSTGTLVISELVNMSHVYPASLELLVGGTLAFIGFSMKAAMVPFHIWLLPAYSSAPVPATGLLSCVLAKTGMYGMLSVVAVCFLENTKYQTVFLTVIYCLGIYTMLHGALCAIFSTHVVKIVAGSSISQMGFIIIGIALSGLLGEENVLAVSGTMLHMFNHSFAKFTLFLVAGVAIMNLAKTDINDIEGFGKKKPLLFVSLVLCAASIAGIPGFMGYVSKTLLHESILEYAHALHGTSVYSLIKTTEWVFLISGGMTLCYMLKLISVLFFDKKSAAVEEYEKNENRKYSSFISKLILIIPGVVALVIGVIPNVLADRIAAYMNDGFGMERVYSPVHYFSLENLKGACISITIGLVLFFVVVRLLLSKKQEDGSRLYYEVWPENFTLVSLVYEPVVMYAVPFVVAFFSRIMDSLTTLFVNFMRLKVFSPVKKRTSARTASFPVYYAGRAVDRIRRKRDDGITYTERFSVKEKLILRTWRLVSYGISFGLLLFCAGLCVTLIYLLTKM